LIQDSDGVAVIAAAEEVTQREVAQRPSQRKGDIAEHNAHHMNHQPIIDHARRAWSIIVLYPNTHPLTTSFSASSKKPCRCKQNSQFNPLYRSRMNRL
jgi:hypothetical protein